MSEEDKGEYARALRLAFSPQEVMDGEGNLKQSYFRPTQADWDKHLTENAKTWGARERALLISGLIDHGVGAWGEIVDAYLPEWTKAQLRVKTQRVLGRQNLKAFAGWHPESLEEIEIVKAFHKAIGVATGTWKGSVLVLDDGGKAEAAIAAAQATHTPGSVISILSKREYDARRIARMEAALSSSKRPMQVVAIAAASSSSSSGGGDGGVGGDDGGVGVGGGE